VIFPTIEFATFFVVVLTVSWLLMPNPALWKPFMLAVSLFFYGFADWRWVLLLVAAIVINQGAATVVWHARDPRARRAAMVAAVVLDLGLLAAFKYYGFFVDSMSSVLDRVNLGLPLPVLSLALPIGISFFTFQGISYVVDVYRGDYPLASPIDTAVYLSFFPHVVAGPIVRAREFIPQLAAPRDPRRIPATAALFLIVGGIVKKVVIADFLAVNLVDPVFGSPAAASGPDTLAAILGYAAQIYCDFSGYTDIAIGLAMLLGYRFPQNFDGPYRATSLQEFWRRWHMTLSRWLRDYLYIPLGGSRRGAIRTYVNLMVTMLLGGLWHGASWTFVVWGAIHGTGLAVQRAFDGWRRSRRQGTPVGPDGHEDEDDGEVVAGSEGAFPAGVLPGGPRDIEVALEQAAPPPRRLALRRPADERGRPLAPALAGWALTFALVCFAWVFFRSPEVSVALEVLSRLGSGWGQGSSLLTPAVVLALVVGLGTQFVPSRWWRAVEQRFARLPLVWQGIMVGVAIVLATSLTGDQGVAPFIYFRF
jgi:D-alanyl-lipoteichoic acid acyltransferase DltB (MBOAT superfamily)